MGDTTTRSSLEVEMGDRAGEAVPDLDDDRQVVVPRQNVGQAMAERNNLLILPILFVMELMKIVQRLMSTVIRAPGLILRRNRIVDEILDELKPKTDELRKEVVKVEEDQQEIQKDIDDIRVKIRRIEERRERWRKRMEELERENAAASDEVMEVNAAANEVIETISAANVETEANVFSNEITEGTVSEE